MGRGHLPGPWHGHRQVRIGIGIGNRQYLFTDNSKGNIIDMYHTFPRTFKKSKNIAKSQNTNCDCNAIAAPNPTQITKPAEYL